MQTKLPAIEEPRAADVVDWSSPIAGRWFVQVAGRIRRTSLVREAATKVAGGWFVKPLVREGGASSATTSGGGRRRPAMGDGTERRNEREDREREQRREKEKERKKRRESVLGRFLYKGFSVIAQKSGYKQLKLRLWLKTNFP